MKHEAVKNWRGITIRRTDDKRAAKKEAAYQDRMFGHKGLSRRVTEGEHPTNRCGKPMRAPRSAEA